MGDFAEVISIIVRRIPSIIAWRGKRQRQKAVDNCSHRWIVYVSDAICTDCRGYTHTDLVKKAEWELLPGLEIVADHSEGSLEPIARQIVGFIYTSNIVKG